MIKINKFLLPLLAVFLGVFAQAQPPCPTYTGDGNGGVGGTTPGAPANPIDMYVIWLAAVAIIFIVFFAKKAINKTKQSV